VTVVKRPFDGGNQVWRCLETKSHWIADIEVVDASSACLDAVGFRDDIPNGVGEPVETRCHRNGSRDFRVSHGPSYRECIA
jgi:hypothetical protein